MSKAIAIKELCDLAAKCGFEMVHEHQALGELMVTKQRRLVAFYSRDRNEGLQMIFDGDAFDSATWHAPTEYVTIVDRRAPGQYGKRDGVSMVADSKKRAVGMSEVRPNMRTHTAGMEIAYMDVKRRLKNANWRES